MIPPGANPLPCGCKAVGTPVFDRPNGLHVDSPHVTLCPLHMAAREMLATLTDIEAATTLNWKHYSKGYLATTLDKVLQLSRAAITKAEGRA